MSSTQFNAGETHGQAQVKAENLVESAKETASNTQEKAESAGDQSAGFLQQTGEQVKSMAQGAIDGVKNTLGVGEQSKN